ncbi:zinc finger protein 317-like isoform X7 [Maniola jurtina]|uniref:zinc finger protein 317-like isoform X7 n=1 Tax=Maniola jurtina TaxID=191418 RepID=UPI001E6881FE|nr:zinc finger protein 317-like isoform X7 [Maniola jurtina]
MGKIKIKKSGQSQQCRCCLKEIGLKELWTEYYNGEEREVYGEMVNDCFALPWEPLFGKTEHICDSCITRLRDAVSFKREILYSNQLLNQEAKNESKLSVKQEEESDLEMETEYLSIEFMDDEDKNLMEIKIEQESKSEMTVKEESSPSKRGKRYTEDDLKKCMEAVMSGKMSQTKASIVYHVPRKTISAAVARKIQEDKDAKREKQKSPNKAKREEMRKHGDNINSMFLYTNATPIRCKNDFGYVCCFCKDVYQEPNLLKDHTIKSHELEKTTFMEGKRLGSYLVKLDITDLQCNICKTGLPTLDAALIHLKEHDKPIHLDINNHIMPFNFEGEYLKCVFCNVIFHKFKKLLEHMSRHYRNCVCDICGAGFINRNTFTMHYHGHKIGSFPCQHCQKVFDTKRKRRSHEMAIHVHAQKTYKCGYCKEHFSTHWQKEKHITTQHGVDLPKIQCQVCEKICLTANSLRIHMKRDHLMERRFECGVCEHRFFAAQELKEHMVKHTGVRDYKCDICLKSYGKKSTLREHIRIHAGDRRFKCQLCEQAFIQKCSLNSHLRSKHGYFQ